MSRRKPKEPVTPAVDLDQLQDNPPSPQDGFDGWCQQQDQQWSTEVARAEEWR